MFAHIQSADVVSRERRLPRETKRVHCSVWDFRVLSENTLCVYTV